MIQKSETNLSHYAWESGFFDILRFFRLKSKIQKSPKFAF